MIIDTLEHVSLYRGMDKKIGLALEFLQKKDPATLPVGKYPIEGENIFALVQEYETKPRKEGKWEAHRKFMDIQFVAKGKEQLGCARVNGLKVSQPYDDKDDCMLLEGEGDFVTADAGTFVVFFPHDAHMPCIAAGVPRPVKKVVVKIRI